MIGIFWVVNFKIRNYFVIFYYTESLPQVIYVLTYDRFLEYLSFEQFKLISRIVHSKQNF
jgi:hypothetical protein